MNIKTGIGQDSHAFTTTINKPLLLGGVEFASHKGLAGNSDADVVLHAITNAISSITCKNILGAKADELCANGVTDSSQYLQLAMQDLKNWQISHVAIAVECLTPKIMPKALAIRKNIANLMHTDIDNVGISATTGEGLSDFGKGKGIQVFSIVSVIKA